MAAAKRAGDDALAALLDAERGRQPEAPATEIEDLAIAALSAPSDYEPAPSIQPAMLAVRVALEPELTFRDEERVQPDGRPKVEWNDGALDGAGADVVDAFVAHQEKWAHPTSLDMLVVTPPRVQARLLARGFASFGGWQVRAWMPRLLLERGASVLPALIAALQSADLLDSALLAAQPVGDVSLVPTIAAAFAGKKYKPGARSWLLRHPRHGSLGAVALVAADAEHADAVRVLRFLDSRGHRDLILEFAESLAIRAHVREVLDSLRPRSSGRRFRRTRARSMRIPSRATTANRHRKKTSHASSSSSRFPTPTRCIPACLQPSARTPRRHALRSCGRSFRRGSRRAPTPKRLGACRRSVT